MKQKLNMLKTLENQSKQLESQLSYVDSKLYEAKTANENISKDKKAYKVLGNFMVELNHDEIKNDLTNTIKRLEQKKEALQKQKRRNKEEIQKMKQDILQNGAEGKNE